MSILLNRNFILPLGILTGMLLGDRTALFKEATVYIIGAVLAVSMADFKFQSFLPLQKQLRPVLGTVFLNYLLFNALLLGLVWWLIPDPSYRAGFVVIAATPPAIAIIPFAMNLGGDANFTIPGVVGGNVLGIFLTPLVLMLFLGPGLVGSYDVLQLVFRMLIVPLFVSRILTLPRIKPLVLRYRGRWVDLGYFIVATTVIGLGRDLLLDDPVGIVLPLLILGGMMFGVSALLERFWVARKVALRQIISLKMMFALKNAGFAAVMAMSLFENRQVALPAALLSILLTLYYVFESVLMAHRQKQKRKLSTV